MRLQRAIVKRLCFKNNKKWIIGCQLAYHNPWYNHVCQQSPRAQLPIHEMNVALIFSCSHSHSVQLLQNRYNVDQPTQLVVRMNKLGCRLNSGKQIVRAKFLSGRRRTCFQRNRQTKVKWDFWDHVLLNETTAHHSMTKRETHPLNRL